MPVRLSSGGTFDDGLPDIKMMLFNHTIFLRVVVGDTEVLDPVLVSKNIQGLSKSRLLSVTISISGPQ